MPVLNVENLSVSFPCARRPFRAVDGVSFAIEEGRTLAFVGETGCGKTMTALALLRLTPPMAAIEAQSVALSGRDLTRFSSEEMRAVRGRGIGMVFQDPAAALNPVLTIGEQVMEALRAHERLPRRLAWERAVHQLGEVGMPDPARAARRYPHELSGGLKQRATIAAAIICRPSLLIADEPTTALDVTVQAQIMDLLARLLAERRMVLLLITHDLGLVAEAADDVAVMYAGRIVERTDVQALFARPLHPYARDLLASVPRLTDATHRLKSIEGTVPDLADLPPGCVYAPRCSERAEGCERPQDLEEIAPGRWVRCWRARWWAE